MKKLFAMMLAAAMCLSLCVPAFAIEQDIPSSNMLPSENAEELDNVDSFTAEELE